MLTVSFYLRDNSSTVQWLRLQGNNPTPLVSTTQNQEVLFLSFYRRNLIAAWLYTQNL
jgi:hypothetical protein